MTPPRYMSNTWNDDLVAMIEHFRDNRKVPAKAWEHHIVITALGRRSIFQALTSVRARAIANAGASDDRPTQDTTPSNKTTDIIATNNTDGDGNILGPMVFMEQE
ncbi:hypothetical protein A4X13_0g7778 [Tilletia indica]|uniref:Uncharacterized protein n=1 Tax=Tilletia indica TaxID=43049 RepID=A0A177TU68_9BASI|nr:hypothetical protein A4X13_0g7778 [Tilletia indica]